MKTTNQNQTQKTTLGDSANQSAQFKNNTAEAPAQNGQSGTDTEKKDSRLPIDTEARKQNRTLPTPKVLNILHAQLPGVYRLAEVVGKWIWVQFKEQPAAEIRQQLAQLGFHWNRERQAWQHPCGNFRLGSNTDPRERYESYFPVRIRRTTKPAAAPQPAAA